MQTDTSLTSNLPDFVAILHEFPAAGGRAAFTYTDQTNHHTADVTPLPNVMEHGATPQEHWQVKEVLTSKYKSRPAKDGTRAVWYEARWTGERNRISRDVQLLGTNE